MTKFKIISCIAEQHDLKLVCLAAAICLFTTFTTFNLVARALKASASTRGAWVAAAAVALGCGIWTTHFVAMLAYHAQVAIDYDMQRTALSIAIAIVGSALGLGIAFSNKRLALPSGVVIGLGIGAMHYTGMSALQVAGQLRYDDALVIDSLLIGAVFSGAAFWIVFSCQTLRARVLAAASLALAICGLHFTGMTATTFVPDNAIAAAVAHGQSGLLAVAIATSSILILALSLIGSLFDEYLANRNVQDAAMLRASEARFRQLANAAFEGVFIHVDGRIVDGNATLCRLLGRPLDELIGHSILDYVSDSSRLNIQERLGNPSAAALEIEVIGSDGTAIPMETLAQSIDYNGTTARVVAMRDLRERRQAEQNMRYLAHHDQHTGLANRTLFNDRLTQALALAQRKNNQVAVLCLDLDRLKSVNDALGHRAGDALLINIAERISRCVRAHDTVARLGSDEFAVIQLDVQQPDEVALLAERLSAAIAEPYIFEGREILISASIGIALFPDDGKDCEALLRSADTALYRAKENGRNRYQFFEATIDLRLQERSRLEHELRQALTTNQQLELHYQPLFDCASTAIVGFEALLRWRHPQRGFVSPAEFIPLAEDSGLIVPLGEWVLNTACRDAAQWPAHLRVAVNLSPVQFRQHDLSATILQTLARTRLPPERLELEITEGVLIEETERTLSTLAAAKAAGIHISLDDFGTGYSSLSYLQRFPFDKLKIDRSFVWNMENSADSMAIVRAIIALGHSLRISVTAEGVETESQLAILRAENCDHVQGFLLGRPQPLQQIQQLLEYPQPQQSIA